MNRRRDRDNVFWTCVKRQVALCLNAKGASERLRRRLRRRKGDIGGDKERKRCHLLS